MTEGRGQRTEDRIKKSEVGMRKSEKGMKTEDRRKKSEVGMRKSEKE